MDRETRKQKIQEIKDDNNKIVMTGIPLRYRGVTLTTNVYQIPLDFLIYNKYNGRIGTDVKSYEIQNGTLNPEVEQDKKKIEGFLFNSKVDRNQITMESLRKNKQQRYGIVTADGIIVDGNRRAMLLNRLFHSRKELGYEYTDVEHCQYFLAIILPVDATPKDIQQLETIYQMGEDDKLDYNPIEKYLKCKELSNYFSIEDIASFMGEKPNQVKSWLEILKLMEEYLDANGYSGIYTRLEKTEGPFVDLQNYLESYKKKGANVREVDWAYGDSDIDDLRLICFDYIRARYEGKEFREIAKTGKEGSIFFHKDLWEPFRNEHVERITQKEESVDELRKQFPGEDLSKLLKSRDDSWANNARNSLQAILGKYSRKLEDKRSASKPADLIDRALSALKMIDTNQESLYSDPGIRNMVCEINRITEEMKMEIDRRCK